VKLKIDQSRKKSQNVEGYEDSDTDRGVHVQEHPHEILHDETEPLKTV
jgi:hypothetical protein